MNFDLSGYSAMKAAGKMKVEEFDKENVAVTFIVPKEQIRAQVDRMKQALSNQSENFETLAADLGKLV
jgi:hypothetical protein